MNRLANFLAPVILQHFKNRKSGQIVGLWASRIVFPYHCSFGAMVDRIDQQYVLKWHYHEHTILKNLPALFESDVLTDVTLAVGTHLVKAHRLVLAMCSLYFLQLFQELGNCQNPVIVLHNVKLEDIKAILAYMYKGQCIVSKEQINSLFSVAKLLKVQGLCDMNVPEKTLGDDLKIFSEIHNKEIHISPNLGVNAVSNESIPKSIASSIKQENSFCDDKKDDECSVKTEASSVRTCWETSLLGNVKTTLSNHNAQTSKKLSKDTSETCKCFLCGKYLSNQYNLRVHIETHEEGYHACQSCPHVSRSRDALRKHVSYRHPHEYFTRKRKKLDVNY